MRRDQNDRAWGEVKIAVKKRDGELCRLVRILSVGDMHELRKRAGSRLNVLDPAHYIPVSASAEHMYDVDNIVRLNRYSHEMLDGFRDPITGKSISKNEVQRWWYKIISSCRPQLDSLRAKGLI